MISESKTRSPKKRFTFWTIITAAVLVLVIGSYFFLRSNEGTAPAGPPEKVTIAYSVSPDAALAQIAQVQGYYLQEGLDATAQRHPSGKAALDALLEGRADFATVSETPVMFAIMNGAKISVLAAIQTSRQNNAILGRKDKGILSPRDLKGRRIAVTSGTHLDFYLDAFLAAQGLSRKDVTVVDMMPGEMPGAVEHGDVDAIAAWSYIVIQAQKRLGDRGIAFSDEDLYTQVVTIVTTQVYARANPEAVKKLLSALVKAEKFAVHHPAEAQAIVGDFAAIDEAVIRERWASVNNSVMLDQSLLLAMEDESQWAIEKGRTVARTVPNYLDFIYFDGLESVKPDAVKVLR